MNFLRTSYISAITNAITIIVKLVVNKVIAYIGPSGFAIYGQFKDFLALATTISQLGTENGIIKYAAETQFNDKAFKTFLTTIFSIHLICSLATTAVVALFKNSINKLLFEEQDYSYLIAITISTLLFLSFYNLILSLLNGLKKLRLFTIITIISTILSGLITVILVKLYNLNGLILSLPLSNVLFFIVSLLVFKRSQEIDINFINLSINKDLFKQLLHFSAMSISGMVSLSLSLLFVRTTIINEIGEFEAGIWDSLWRLSAIYYVFLVSSFKFYLLPTFTTLQDSLVKKEILKVWKITFPIILFITLFIYLFQDLIIKILFTEEFMLIKTIILFQLLGDVIRIHGWTLGNLLMAKSKTKTFVTLQWVWGLVFCTSTYFFLKKYGLVGSTIGYFITCTVHFILLNICQYKLVWGKPLKNY